MFLQSFEIKNYRSLEHVQLNNLLQFNVLIGRNNAGKSSVFGALELLNRILTSQGVASNILTTQDVTRSLEIRLTFEPHKQDREEFIKLLIEAGYSTGRYNALLNSPLLRQIEFFFKSVAARVDLLHLRETKLRAEDGQWAVIQKMVGEEYTGNPSHKFVNIAPISKEFNQNLLSSALLGIEQAKYIDQFNFAPSFFTQVWHSEPVTRWPQDRLIKYFTDAFFFNPFRHSTDRLIVQETPLLTQDGSNLAQVLHTINSNDRSKFQEIEDFIQSALPDIGCLQTRLVGNQTEVSFRSRKGNYLTRLHDMGGGIEQLLMVAVVLLTTRNESTLFLEEPESHLHAGAQRFLLERLYQGERQIFITTHSPTFINMSKSHSLYQVTYKEERTKIERCAAQLDTILEDIGVRNSDVLLSDAVFFVEGPSDRDVLNAWSEALGTSLAEHNVSLLPMGGGQSIEHGAPIRSEVLTGISQKAHVPHLFLLDRDERRQTEIHKLEKMLGDKVHLLELRELENYLLIPRPLLKAIRSKHRNDAPIVERVDQTSEEQVEQLIHTSANSLYNVVLLKRIRTELEGLKGGLLPREDITELIPYAESSDLADIILKSIKGRIDRHLANIGINAIVCAQREALQTAWADPQLQLQLAPGEEIVAAVFRNFGSNYNKSTDAVRIAKEMHKDEIHPEIQEVIQKALNMVANL